MHNPLLGERPGTTDLHQIGNIAVGADDSMIAAIALGKDLHLHTRNPCDSQALKG